MYEVLFVQVQKVTETSLLPTWAKPGTVQVHASKARGWSRTGHQKDAHDGASPWITAMAWGTARWDGHGMPPVVEQSVREPSSVLRSIAQPNPAIASRPQGHPPPAFDGQAPYVRAHKGTVRRMEKASQPILGPWPAWELIGGASRWTPTECANASPRATIARCM
ncbi:hypothetical protein M431DRAFT_357354 [Trichoderma harzianum CBS 226.95]|jgi:hypothetical protein|uniref:Uncharacterized protein n=1 Tax=Trichoderma harzianum CBS 226.95 TaxID=983964 RepID=A0A2T4ALV1_TRIHA|nr:hypothetical protein M431DRAFT_357354 [Trichoderma harzianum CBS 226.95]PTB58061.1 hypothetical protein M431DRAFT_357354 [Trichoderma harzianum CBS 226.95]